MNTEEKRRVLEEAGYKVVTFWECEWKEELASLDKVEVKRITEFAKAKLKVGPMNIRGA